MTPEEFIALRKMIGQPDEVAALMECGTNAIWRWENGQRGIQGPVRVLIRMLAAQAQAELAAEQAEVQRLAKINGKEKTNAKPK